MKGQSWIARVDYLLLLCENQAGFGSGMFCVVYEIHFCFVASTAEAPLPHANTHTTTNRK